MHCVAFVAAPMVPSGQISQLAAFPAAAYWPSGHTTDSASPPVQYDPATHALQLAVALDAPTAVEALPGAHVMGAQDTLPPELHWPRTHCVQPSVGVPAPCPDGLPTTPLPAAQVMGLQDEELPAENWPEEHVTGAANPPAQAAPAVQLEHDTPLT